MSKRLIINLTILFTFIIFSFNKCHANLDNLENKLAQELLNAKSSKESFKSAYKTSAASLALVSLAGFITYLVSSNECRKEKLENSLYQISKLNIALNILHYPVNWYLEEQINCKEKTLQEIKEFKVDNASNDIQEFLSFLEEKENGTTEPND